MFASAKIKYPGNNNIELSPPSSSLFSTKALKAI